MRSVARALWFSVLALVLSACGGGGGGGGDGGSPAALTFAPAIVTANVASGSSATVTVRATASDPSIFGGTVYVYVVDSAQVLTPAIAIAQIDSKTFSATLHTAPGLAPGRYQGSFQVKLCNNSSCSSQVAGSPVSLPYDLTITEAPLQASAASMTSLSVHRGGSIATPVVVNVSGPQRPWTATTTDGWLRVTGGSGTGGGSFSVELLTQALAEGHYAGSVTVSANDGQTVSLPFTLDVLPTQFSINSGIATFTAVNGAPIPAQTLGFALNNGVLATWSATTSAPWLVATPLGGTTPAVITLQPDPTRGALASGTYSADVVLSSPGIADTAVTTQLVLSKATLSAPTSTLTFGGPKGRDLTTAQTLLVSLSTGTNSWPFSLSGVPAWLSAPSFGVVNGAGTALALQPKPASVQPGSTSQTVSVTAAVNGDSVVLPLTVNLNADQRRLLASEWGVAFASSPTGTTLSRTLKISDNFAGALSWSASSDAAWLSVTPSGSTAGSSEIVLAADASPLPPEAVSYANVTVRSATAGVEPAVVRVAVWKSASGLAALQKLSLDYAYIAADTIRPYVYANNRGTTIDVYNAYTAQKIATIPAAGAALGQMSISLDGSRLYALDAAARSMVVVDLTTMTRTATWSLDSAVDAATAVQAVRPNGVEVVLVGNTAYTAGRSLGQTFIGGPMVTTADGQRVYSLGGRTGVDYSAMSGGILFVSRLGYLDGNSGGNARDVAVSRDGTRAYEASGGGVNSPGRYMCAAIDGTTGTFIGGLPGGDAYPNNVEVTADGRAICGIDGWYATSDFWVHAPSGALLKGYKVAGYARGLKDRQMAVTPDGFIVVALTSDPLIAFVPIGQ